ncbi:MAG TPA: protein kinase [Polyangiaceae bacterium]|nr:protein kinase [Polyangiaceae bacterium]
MERLRAGSVLAGRYRLDSVLGRGGMGSVWLAHHLTLDSPVAVKLIDPEIAAEPEAIERFMREAQAAAALRSPHVVQTLDYGVHDRTPYIAMELLEGESLAGRLSRVRCLTPAQTGTVLTHIARAVGKAHELGIVHRDLKPENVFLVCNDDEEIAKVLDFGIAKRTTAPLGGRGSGAATSQTRTGAILGTPYYMSPEQAEGAKNIDHRSDLWAMGVIAFECLLGERPFQGASIGELVLKICSKPMPTPSARGPVPAGFDAWFAKACARDPERRFKSVRELVDAFRSSTLGKNTDFAAREEALPAPLPGPAATTTGVPVSRDSAPPAQRARSVVWIGLAAAGVVLAGIGGALWYAGGGSVPPARSAMSSLAPASPTTAPPAEPGVEQVHAEAPGTSASAPAPPPLEAESSGPPSPEPAFRESLGASGARRPRARPARAAAPASSPATPERAPAPSSPSVRALPPAPRADEPTDFGF